MAGAAHVSNGRDRRGADQRIEGCSLTRGGRPSLYLLFLSPLRHPSHFIRTTSLHGSVTEISKTHRVGWT